jgi:hypothetical protein
MPLDADEIVPEGGDGLVGQPLIEALEALLPGEDLEPGDLAFAAVGLLDRGVEDAHGGGPDVRARAVAANERYDRLVRDAELAVDDRDLAAGGGSGGGGGHGKGKTAVQARRVRQKLASRATPLAMISSLVA